MELMGRIFFWFKSIGLFLTAITLVLFSVAFVHKQVSAQQSQPEMVVNGKTITSSDRTITVKKGAAVSVILYGLSRFDDAGEGKGYILRVRHSPTNKNFDFSIPAGDTCDFSQTSMFLHGNDNNGNPLSTFCVDSGSTNGLRGNIVNNILVNVLTNVTNNPLPCGDKQGNRCEIQLLFADGKSAVSPPAVLALTGNTTTTPGQSSPSVVRLSVRPSAVYLGQKLNVTLNDMPIETTDTSTGYRLFVVGQESKALEITTNATNNTITCTATNRDPSSGLWENYNRTCTPSEGLYSYTTSLNTNGLSFTLNESSWTYQIQLNKNGKKVTTASFTVKNELGLKLEGNPARGKSPSPNELSVDENVPITMTAIGCTTGNVQFQLWGEPAGLSCAEGGTCGYEDGYPGVGVANQDTATATYNISSGLQLIGVTKRPLDQNNDGVAEIGVRATCQDTDKTAKGKILLYKEGTIQIEVVETIIENYDKGVKGLEVIPIVDPKSTIKYSVYGLRAGAGSVGGGPLDRSNCFYVELFRGGTRLKRPANYPDAYLGQIRQGQPNCLQNEGETNSAILLDRPEYVFHVFDGGEDSGDQYSNIILCAASACKRSSNQTTVLADGEYTLKIYEANGLSTGPMFRAECLVSPNLSNCGNVEDSLVASTTFQVGSAFSNATTPPCKVALVQYPDPANPGQILTVKPNPEFDSINEFNEFFADEENRKAGYFMSKCLQVDTALGLFATDPAGFVSRLLGFLLGISGAIALLLIIRAGYQVMMSRGDPEKLGEAREHLTSAIVGLLFIIFSLVILEVIGVDILRIPGLCRAGDDKCLDQGSAIDPNVTPTPEEP